LGDEGLSSPYFLLRGEIQELANPDVFGWVFYLENTETYLEEKTT
jgi:hypothetical protein